MNGQQVITIDGDVATDIHYCQASLVQEEDGRDVLTEHSIRYTDTLVNRDGQWLISRREQHFVLSEKRDLLSYGQPCRWALRVIPPAGSARSRCYERSSYRVEKLANMNIILKSETMPRMIPRTASPPPPMPLRLALPLPWTPRIIAIIPVIPNSGMRRAMTPVIALPMQKESVPALGKEGMGEW